MNESPLSLARAAAAAFALVLLFARPASGAVTYSYTFDKDASPFDGTDGWDNGYCADGWTTTVNGGVQPLTDDGCVGEQCPPNGAGCKFGIGTSCSGSDAFDNHLKIGSPLWKDYVFTARFKNTDNDTFGFVFRYKNTAQFYLLSFSNEWTPSMTAACGEVAPGSRLIRVKGGVPTLLAQNTLTNTIGAIHLVRISVAGAHIKVEFDADADGQLAPAEVLFDLDDLGGLTSGRAGFYAYDNGYAGDQCPLAADNCWFDDVKVEVQSIADDACSGITYEGICDGNTLKYCFNGDLLIYQCLACCKWNSQGGYNDCLDWNACTLGCASECQAGQTGCDKDLGSAFTCLDNDGDGCLERVFEACQTGLCNLATGTCASPCQGTCTGKVCGDDGCGGSCGACPAGQACQMGACVCVPACGGKQCGPDGCGGQCGTCALPGDACVGGLCVCQPSCFGKVCGDDGCGGDCGPCLPGELCVGGACSCVPDCTGKACGSDGCGGACGACAQGEQCQLGQCVCVPDCAGKACGFDGCQGLCGLCQVGESCLDGACHQGPCVPDCAGKACGDDGCGALCGQCPEGWFCQDNQCYEPVCVPDCSAKECGPDGCGGDCGDCPEGASCAQYQCVCEHASCGEECCDEGQVCLEDELFGPYCCTLDCKYKDCGENGCGGSCGQCPDGYACNEAGKCVPPQECIPQSYMKCYGIGLFWYDSCDQKGEIVLVCDHECAGDHCVEPPGPEPLDEVLSPEAAEADASPQVDTSGHPVGDDAADSGAAAEGAVMSAGPKDGSCSTGSAPASGLTFLLAGLILAVVAARGCRRRPRWGSGA